MPNPFLQEIDQFDNRKASLWVRMTHLVMGCLFHPGFVFRIVFFSRFAGSGQGSLQEACVVPLNRFFFLCLVVLARAFPNDKFQEVTPAPSELSGPPVSTHQTDS